MSQPTVIVVGGGVIGLATACALAEQGAGVTVLERFTIGHDWASSHGLSRAIRHEYGQEAIYTAMVAQSLMAWDELAQRTGRRLYAETGVLTLGQPDDGHTLAGYDVMCAAGLPIERLSAAECERRFPAFRAGDFGAITYNATGGMLFASECLLALADRLRELGGVVRAGVRVASVAPTGDHGAVRLADGTLLTADRVVVTAGPWVHDILPDLRLPVRPTRQQITYFSGLPTRKFGIGVFPIFLAGMHYYGFPLHGAGWFKAASHAFGSTVDPNMPYGADEAEIADIRTFLRQTIPAAADAPLAFVDHCMYDLTPDEDFILDQHPGGPGVIIGSGFSGHGFKFGIVIGHLLAALALDSPPAFALDRFRLTRFA